MSRKEKMKVYHGIPKSPTDEHTIFYASFDGNLVPEINKIGVFPSLNATYTPSPIGHKMHSITRLDSNIFNFPSLLNEITIDFWVEIDGVIKDKHGLCTIFEEDGKYISCALTNSESLYCNVSGSVKLSEFQKDNQKFYHIRVSAKSGDYVKIYVNGVLYHNKAYNSSKFMGISIGCYYYLNKPSYTNFNNLGVCDYHISNIDRSNYFPNLPQDFIEGKAIIKERLGQQQIKGDPLISQETSVVVPAYVGDKRKLYQLLSDKSGQLLDNPEITNIWGADSWSNGSYLKIKALNNEVISGVIDSDTAIFKVLSSIQDNVLVVDDVSKISVGDSFLAFKSDISNMDKNNIYVVTNIDSTTNTVTFTCSQGGKWNQSSINTGWNRGVEITATTSSPTVKTTDGTTVVGTWTGLGTNVATFTLGTNTGLSGKDLVVTYSLNMPQGNSHFPELPYDIERAYTETGIEMKPVSDIVIEDDFRGKLGGVCPHICKYSADTKILLPTDSWYDSADQYYEKMYYQDSNTFNVNNRALGAIPKTLFSFNLIEMVERKLGCEIPSRDKIQWLKDNIINYTCTAYGNGTNPSGNKYILNNYCVDETRWYGDPKVHFQSQISEVSYTQISPNWIAKSIDSKGYTHFIVYTDASDGVTISSVSTDYVKLEIKLKMDSTFTTLYCDNKRAREDKCNPVLVQKETKTVKRYIPSKECFVTESKYVSPPKLSPGSLYDTIFKADFIYLTTLGSGAYVSEDVYRNCLNKLGDYIFNTYDFSGETIYKSGINVYNREQLLKFVKIVGQNTPSNTYGVLSLDISDKLTKNVVALKPFLVNKNGQLNLALWVGVIKDNNLVREDIYYYETPNRPLIK